MNSTGQGPWFKLYEFEGYSRVIPGRFMLSLATSFFLSPTPFCKCFVLDTEVRQVWQHETFSRKYQFKWNVLDYLTKTMSSSADQLSSHTLLGVSYTRSVEMHLQIEYCLDNSEQLVVKSVLTGSRERSEESSQFPLTLWGCLPSISKPFSHFLSMWVTS